MINIFKAAISFFKDKNVYKVEEYAYDFGKQVTKNIVNQDIDSLKSLYKNSVLLREDVEFDEDIERGIPFYYGYCFAYENIAKLFIDETGLDLEIDKAISNEPRLGEIVRYLSNNNFAQQKEIAEYLKISSNNLCNYLNKDIIKNLKIFSTSKLGRNVIYSLNKRGRDYYNKKISMDNKQYSKSNIQSLLDSVFDEDKLESPSNFIESCKILDKQLAEYIYDKLYFKELKYNINLIENKRVSIKPELTSRLQINKQIGNQVNKQISKNPYGNRCIGEKENTLIA